MKKFTKVLFIISVALVLSAVVVPTKTEVQADIMGQGDDNDVSYTLDDSGLLTISGTGVIEPVFWKCDKDDIKKVVIQNGIRGIGNNAFYCCSSLISIEIPSSVTSIDYDAFSNCSSLTSIEIPSSVTSIGDYAFYGCSSLTSIEIPSSVTSIGEKAFYNTEFYNNQPDGLIYISKYLIGIKGTCSSTIVVKTGTRLIAGMTFSNCSSLTSIEIPESVTSIGNSAFSGCSGLTSIEIPSGVTSIGNSAFSRCSGLTSIEIPNSVTSIGYYAFSRCSGLTSIKIPSGVTSIGNGAFYGCSGLTSIIIDENNRCYDSRNNCNAIIKTSTNELIIGCNNTIIPSGVTNIGDSAFSGCSGLTSIDVPESVTIIGNYAFYGCSGLTSIEIPSGVASIGEEAFLGCSGLTSIEIPSSVTSIGGGAFSGCSGLTSMEIPSNVTSIGNSAFSGCSGLISIEIPSGVTSIGNSAFYGCSGLTSIEIPSGVSSIDYSTFSGCSGLTSIEIPSNVTSIGNSAFSGCSGLTSIEIPSSVSSIGYSVFSKCSGITKITIPFVGTAKDGTSNTHFGYIFGAYSAKNNGSYVPSSLGEVIITGGTSIADSAFSGCSGLTSIEIPSVVTSIGNSAFYNCSGLTSIEIPSGVTSIDYSTFSGCSGLTSIEIPSVVTSIGNSAFYNCSGLTSIEIPSGVTSIGYSAFSECSGLNKITIPFVGAIKDGTSNTNFGYIFGAYRSENNDSYVPNLLGEVIITGGTSIDNYAFYGCSELITIDVPESVTSIGYYAFYGCSNLKSIDIPENVTSIGGYAFSGCSGLTSIEIPSDVSRIDYSTFSGCSGLTRIEIPSSVFSIGEEAFSGCSGLTSIEIPSGVTSIGEEAFYGCSSLTKITIPFVGTAKDGTSNTHFGYIFGAYSAKNNGSYVPSSLGEVIITGGTCIADSAFSGCSELTSIEIPSGVTGIGNSAFSGCSGLTSIEIPSGVTSIGNSAFFGCSGLTSMEIPIGVTSIGNRAFSSCSGLTSIEIPSSVTSIGGGAFSGCSGLTSMEIPSGVTNIGDVTFFGCSGLTSIKIPSSVTSIGSNAFFFVKVTVYYESDEWLSVMKGDYGGTLTWVKKHTHNWQDTILPNDENIKAVATNESPAQYWKVCPDDGEISTTEFFEYGKPLTPTTAEFETVSVKVGSSLALQISVSVTENIDNPKMRYTINGSEVVKDGTLKDGKWHFELDGITPNLMASKIMMEVMDGDKVVAEKEYCIKEYCDALYSLTADELGITPAKKTKLDIFLADMLEYGAMTQKYLGETSGDLANSLSWVAEKKSTTFTAPSSEKNTIVSARDSYDKIVSAHLALNDCIETYFVLKATNATQVEIFDGNNTKTIPLDSNTDSGTVTVSAGKLTATELDTKYTITLKENNTVLHQITYSVNSYIASKCNDTDINLANLVKAIYNYGLSAKKYQNYTDGIELIGDSNFPVEASK